MANATFGVNILPKNDTVTIGNSNSPWTIVSPSLTGTPTAPTPAAGDDSTKVATTEFVGTAIDNIPVIYSEIIEFELDNVSNVSGSYSHTSTVTGATANMKAVGLTVGNSEAFLDDVTITFGNGTITLQCDNVVGSSTVTVAAFVVEELSFDPTVTSAEYIQLNSVKLDKATFNNWRPSNNGTNDQILRSNGDGTTRWDSPATTTEINTAVTSWLNTNVPTGTTVVIDRSLTQDNCAANSKTVGDELSGLKSALDAYENAFDDYLSKKIEPVFTGSKAINSNGEYVSGSYCATAPYYSIENAVIGGKIHGRVEKVSGGKDLVIKPYFYSSESEASNVPSAIDERVREDDFSFTVPTGAKYVRFYVYKYDWSSTKPTDIESVYFYDYSNIKELNDNSDTILGLIPTVNSLSDVVKTTGKVTFEQGSYAANGSLSDRNDRIRGKEYIAVDDIFSVTVDSGFLIWYNEYNASKTNLRQNTNSNTKLTKDSFSQDAVYVRFIVRYVANNTNITPSTNTGFFLQTNIGKVVESIQENTDELILESTGGTKNKFYSAIKRYSYILDSATVVSDQTVMGNKLLCFTSGNDERTTNGQIKVFTYGNGFDHTVTASKTIYHRLGHCNAVDYNEENDCLILGNGSGSYTLAGEIFIVPNFQSIIDGSSYTDESTPLTLANSNAIVIDCSAYDLGTKFNVIWGERNGTKNNIAYLITAKYGSNTSASDAGDNGTIRRILLGMGSNELDMGSLISAEENEFNGTFKITDTYTQPGTNYANCNQGCCFFNGKIYSCIGHDGQWIWAMSLDNKIHRIWYDEYKQKTFADDGSIVGNNQANSTGICYHDGYFFVGMLGIGIVAIKEF